MATTSQQPDRIAKLWAEYQPRLAQARKHDADGASLHFVELHEERLGELPAVPLTIERYLLLQQAGVFEGRNDLTVNPVLLFLWIVSPDFKACPTAGKAFFKANEKLDLVTHAQAVADYLGRMFQLMPAGKKGSGESGGGSSDWVASIVDLIASEYGWQEADILTIPLPRLFQYVSRITTRMGGLPFAGCQEADRIKAEFMAKANAMKGENASG